MRQPTKHLRKLKRSLAQAEKIASRVPEHGSITPLHHLKVQSFVLLSHAAFEEYLEELGRDTAREARRQFKSSGRVTYALVALVTAKLIDEVALEKAKKRITEELISNLDVFSESALNRYEAVVRDNNGILERNQKNILYPIGIDPEATDTVLMNALHAYGQSRGSIAHSFSMVRTEYTLGGVKSDIATLLAAISSYDKAACDSLNLSLRKQS